MKIVEGEIAEDDTSSLSIFLNQEGACVEIIRGADDVIIQLPVSEEEYFYLAEVGLEEN